MTDSILNDVKQVIGGYDSGVTPFDQDIILFVNGVFSILHQLGVGPDEGFYIKDASTKWSDLLGNDRRLNFVKTYVALKTRLYFDPPQNSFLVNEMEKQVSELEWRINDAVDPEKW